jgi:hypothetical protein
MTIRSGRNKFTQLTNRIERRFEQVFAFLQLQHAACFCWFLGLGGGFLGSVRGRKKKKERIDLLLSIFKGPFKAF